jgi:SAM-dependent methyltransferase
MMELSTWERSEVERSAIEAAQTASAVHPTRADVFLRYQRPPADTAYPLEYAFHLAGDLAGRSVLDLGAGSGGNASLLASRGARVCALDLSPDLLRLAAARAALDGFGGVVTPLCGSAHAIPLPAASVDFVFGNAILHHVDLDRAAVEIRRVLKPGGRAVFKEPVRDSRAVALLRPLIPFHRDPISSYERPLRQAEIDAFTRHFTTGRQRRFWLPFVSVLRLSRFRDRDRMPIFEWDRAILRRWPRLSRLASVAVFEVIR